MKGKVSLRALGALFCLLLLTGNSTPAVASNIAQIVNLYSSTLLLPDVVPAGRDLTTCNGFWGRTGYACDKSRVAAYLANDSTYLDSLKNDLNQRWKEMFEVLKWRDYGLWWNVIYFRYTGQKLIDHETSRDRCWAEMKRIRNSSVCTACSATNFKYFVNGKMGVQKADCDRFFDICHVYFDNIYDLNYRFEDLFAPVFNPYGPNFFASVEPTLGLFRNAVYNSNINQFTKLLKDFVVSNYSYGPNSKWTIDAKMKICEQSLIIYYPPILKNLTDFYVKMMYEINRYKTAAGMRMLSLPNKKSRLIEARSLQDLSQTSTSSLLQTEVVVGLLQNNDPTQQLVTPAGTPLGCEPANLTLAFVA